MSKNTTENRGGYRKGHEWFNQDLTTIRVAAKHKEIVKKIAEKLDSQDRENSEKRSS